MVANNKKQEILNKLGKSLNLAGIFLVSSNVESIPGISNSHHLEGERQTLKGLVLITFEQRDNGDNDDYKYRYRIRYKFGIRYVNNDLEEDDKDFVLIEITADFEAYYSSYEEIPEEEIEVFSELNAPYNIWPYWREYVQSTCARMGLPPIDVPFETNIQDV